MEVVCNCFIWGCLFCYMSVCFGQRLVTPLRNIVGFVGRKVVLTVTYEKSNENPARIPAHEHINFSFYSSGGRMTIWNELRPNDPLPETYFAVSSNSEETIYNYNLVIDLPRNEDDLRRAAVRYGSVMPLIPPQPKIESAARVMALRKFECRTSQSSDVRENSMVDFTCSVNFVSDMGNNIDWRPSLTWVDGVNSLLGPVKTTTNLTAGIIMIQYARTAEVSDHQKLFLCRITIVDEPYVPNSSSLDRIPPSFIDHCVVSFSVYGAEGENNKGKWALALGATIFAMGAVSMVIIGVIVSMRKFYNSSRVVRSSHYTETSSSFLPIGSYNDVQKPNSEPQPSTS